MIPIHAPKVPADILAGLMVLILSACAPAAAAQPAAAPTAAPNEVEPVANSEPACQAAGLNIFRDETQGYCFAYPLEFEDDGNGVIGPPLDSSPDPLRVSLYVTVQLNSNGSSLDQLTDAFLSTYASPGLPVQRVETQVSGQEAMMMVGVPGLPTFRAIVVPHNDQVYQLILSPEPTQWPAAQSQANNLLHAIVSTFTFTD